MLTTPILKKIYYEQPRIVAEILHNRKINKDIHNMVKGVMIESFIEEGNQKQMAIFMGNLLQTLVSVGILQKNYFFIWQIMYNIEKHSLYRSECFLILKLLTAFFAF